MTEQEPQQENQDKTLQEIPSLLDPGVLDDPFETYAEMREHCPVRHLPEMDLHIVTRFDDAKQVLTDPATFSNNPSARGARPTDAAKAAARVFRERGWVRARRCSGQTRRSTPTTAGCWPERSQNAGSGRWFPAWTNCAMS